MGTDLITRNMEHIARNNLAMYGRTPRKERLRFVIPQASVFPEDYVLANKHGVLRVTCYVIRE